MDRGVGFFHGFRFCMHLAALLLALGCTFFAPSQLPDQRCRGHLRKRWCLRRRDTAGCLRN